MDLIVLIKFIEWVKPDRSNKAKSKRYAKVLVSKVYEQNIMKQEWGDFSDIIRRYFTLKQYVKWKERSIRIIKLILLNSHFELLEQMNMLSNLCT